MCKNMPPLELAIQFHGHICPGLLMGVRVAEFAQQYLDVSPDQDEELLAVVETNSCGVDAIQSILGCTFGKGNLIFKDYGKSVYTIASREKNRAVRIVQKYQAQPHPDNARYRELNRREALTEAEAAEKENLLASIFERIMTTPFEEMFSWREVDFALPEKAQIYPTVQCSICGEGVMEPRAIMNGQLYVCPTCA
ncbi:MAG TPA: FmdE family protein [Syntrophomonadaceae bacterium]|jgi:formylmethanofuran dehydrogenase subunit E|nr:FmdE family protein [Syntrophomonadaceae bacterium]